MQLIIPNRKNNIKEDPFSFFNIKRNFSYRKILSPEFTFLPRKINFLTQSFMFALSIFFFTLNKKDQFYSRDEIIVATLALLNKKVIWEAHQGSYNVFVRFIFQKKIPIVTISNGIKRLYLSKGALNDIIVVPDGVCISDFILKDEKKELRIKTGLDHLKRVILYTGHLYGWKGVDTLAESARYLPTDITIVFVGGTDEEIAVFKKKYTQENILILGRRKHADMPYFLKSSDMLILPNSSKEDISKYYTSPMKLFEYMASGVPIVASDLPSIREILDESNAVFFEPDNPRALASVINDLFRDEEKQLSLVKKQVYDATRYDWVVRADVLLSFFTKSFP